MVIYEQPLNEKIRLFFRLETLFSRFDHYYNDDSLEASHSALITLLELHDMTSRLDVKSAILKTIDHQSMTMRGYEESSDVNTEQLSQITQTLEEKAKELYSFHGQLGQHLKSHYFLNSIQQRMNVAGGVNGSDLPIFNYWLHQSPTTRKAQLNEWLQPYQPSREAITIAMDLIRQSARSERVVAPNGFYQSGMDMTQNAQMIRIELPENSDLLPEVSAGKQRYSIRFVSAGNLIERSKQVQHDVEFDLVICGF